MAPKAKLKAKTTRQGDAAAELMFAISDFFVKATEFLSVVIEDYKEGKR